MDSRLRILMVEDNPADADLNAEGLTDAGVSFEYRRVETRDEYVKALEEFKPDVILADYRLPQFDGITALRLAHEQYPFIPFIIVSGVLEEEAAVELFREGASDYVRKGNLARLGQAVKKALELRDAQEAKAWAEDELRASYAQLEQRVKERTAELEQEIRERKKTEAALRESEEKFRAVLENSLDAAYRRNLRTDTYDYLSPVIRNITGYSVDEFKMLAVRSVLEMIHPDDAPAVRAELDGLTASPKSETVISYRLKGKDGHYRWVADSIRVLRGANGIPLYLNGSIRDISDRMKAEETLRKSEEEFRTLAENAPAGIMRLDAQGTYLYVNHEAEKIMQSSPENIVGRKVGMFGMPGEAQEEFRKDILQTLETRQPTSMEFALPRKERTYHYLVRFVPEPSRGGQGTVLAIFSEITDLKETEARLQQARETAERRANEAEEGRRILDAIMEYIPEGLLVADGKTKTVQMASSFVADYAGMRREQMRGMSLGEYRERLQIAGTKGDPLRPEEIPLSRTLASGQVVIDEEYILKKKDGEKVNALLNSVPIKDARGAITGAVASWRDITERKRAEDTLRRNEYELRTLVDNSPDLIFRLNRAMQYTYANPAYERLTGIPRDQMVNRTNAELGMPPNRVDLWRTNAEKVLQNGREETVEFDMDSFFGKRFFSARLIPEFAKSGLVETVLVIARDITERRQAEEQIRYISFHDEVTGLYNRAFFEEEIRRVDTERNLPVSIIMGDVNNLKLTNDVFGHDEGDKLLKAIAESIRRACRLSDIVARWGGDEFAVILPKTDFVTADGICSRIGEITRGHKGMALLPSVAVGISAKEHRDQNIYQVIRQAEQRMYDFKLARAAENEAAVLSSLRVSAQDRIPGFGEHVDRIIESGHRFVRELGMSEEFVQDLDLLMQLHDIGKSIVPAGVLLKPGPLTRDEWDIMKKHSEAGFRIVKTFADTAKISDEVLSHAEHWDGSGYPRGIKGKEIPYLSRVFQIVDVYDIMTHPRPYARTLTPEDAVEELRRNAGTRFDPELTDIFIRTVTDRPVPSGS